MLSDAEIDALDVEVERALAEGDESRLAVLAYGEISVVLALETAAGAVACKRLPVFPDREALERYWGCLDRYLTRLAECGVEVVASELKALERSDGRWVGYCVQPLLPAESLVVSRLRAGAADAKAVLAQVVDAVVRTVSPRLGLDAQLSNWAYVDGRLLYLDITTPLLRDARGAGELDADLFLAALPWPLRAPVRWWVLGGITDTYHEARRVIVDAIANLYKEGLSDWVPRFIEIANARVEPAITASEVERYYRSDARTWAALLWLRRVDQAWHRRVLRRPYPFLLPRKIERHV